MHSLFSLPESDIIINRINKLNQYTKPHWGKMNSAQMLAHLQKPLEIAFGHKVLKRSFIGLMFGKMAKNKMLKQDQFSKNMPTDSTFIVKDERDFEIEKTKTISLIKKMLKDGPNGLTKNPHPFFGRLTVEEWDILQFKHLDHHLRQFGV